MQAYTFLRRGAVGRLTGVAWPLPRGGVPGDWLVAPPGSDAARGCRREDLPYWLDDELWEVELDGRLDERDHLVLAERGRLIGPVPAWNARTADAFTDDCARRVQAHAAAELRSLGRDAEARELEACGTHAALERTAGRIAARGGDGSLLAGLAGDLVLYARDAGFGPTGAAVAGYLAAHALAGGDRAAAGYDERFAGERARQAAWLGARLDR